MATRLLYAALHSDYATLIAAIDDGCSLEDRDEYGTTALMVACTQPHSPRCALALVEAKSDINAANNAGWTPLLFAALHKNDHIVDALIQAGSDVNARTTHDWTILQVVVNFRYMDFLNGTDTKPLERIAEKLISVGSTWEDIDLFDDHHWVGKIV